MIIADILKFVSYLYQKTGFDILCRLSPYETFARNVKACFPGKISSSLLSAELTPRVVKINKKLTFFTDNFGHSCYIYVTAGQIPSQIECLRIMVKIYDILFLHYSSSSSAKIKVFTIKVNWKDHFQI